MAKVSVIIPAFNEEKAVGMVVEEVQEVLKGIDFEVIVVDDGSTDKTFETAKKCGVKVVKHGSNKGKVAAIRTGIANSTGNLIVLTDADYTYPAAYIPQFVEILNEGADLVLGSRVKKGLGNIPLFNRIGNILFSMMISYIGCVHITDGQTGYRAFRKKDFEKLDVDARGLEFETKMTVKAAKNGYNVVEVPVEYRPRIGKSKLNPLLDGYRMVKSLFSILLSETSFITKTFLIPTPLFFLVGLGFGVISLFEKMEYGVLEHQYYPLLAVFMILFSMQLFSLGLVVDFLTKKLDRIDEKLRRKP
ncbi:MAG: glycosyltransferase family 2 protein [Candidatus Altiarchaeales archaeon]|nr:glycosyltransferase family 2 protein [Candidatus Altiarchaeales archaeon]